MSLMHYRLEGHEVVPVEIDIYAGAKGREQLLAWAQWFETADRTVMRTELIDGSVISTVFLALDHSYGVGPPLLFETALVSGEEQFDSYFKRMYRPCEVVARYSTWAEAQAGHMEWIERCVAPDMIAATVAHGGKNDDA
jgi:hypothetical protein